MTPILATRAQRTATLLAAVVLFAVGFVPLFGGPGYEAALAAGLVLPALAATATAFDVVGSNAEPFAALVRGASSGAALAAIGLAVCFVHGVREGFCDAVEGTELFLLGPSAGSVLGGVWGGIAGLVARARLRAPGERALSAKQRALVVAFAVAGPVAGIGVSVVRFYTSPMVFAFDPFVGFFAGTLYDSVITGMSRLITYRMGSLATLVAAFAGASLLRPGLGGPMLAARTCPAAAALAVLATAASVTHWLGGAKMGHYQTAATIREALGQELTVGRCELVYPTGTPKLEAAALARECNAHLGQLDRFFGVKGPERVVAFVFASADQKGYLMGAAGTYIAKPWRREIYIQRAGFPHPVMRHELAHVEAGTFGAGLFRVAGPLRGLIPDPGRIEGVAVAAAPRDEVLSLDEWAKAMRDLKLLPPLDRVFKLSFLGEPSSRAYVVAGAFVDWLRREKGMEVVRGWYSGQSLESLTKGVSLGELERSWQASLDRLKVGEDVLQVARARFDQPAIFGRRCPHVVDRLGGDAGAALAQFDTARARELYGELLALDPHDLGARLGLATCAQRDGAEPTARALYEKIGADKTLARAARARALESLGDLALAAGQAPEARRRFEEVRAVVVDPDRLRTLDVKEYAADAPGREAIVLHLMGDPVLGRSATAAAAALGAWSEREPAVGLADYLLARTYAGEARYSLVAASLDAALGKTLPVPTVVREAYKLRLITACVLGDRERVDATYAKWLSLDGPRPPERAEVAELVERCTGRPAPVPAAIAPNPATPATPTAPPQNNSGAPDPPGGGSRCPEGMTRIPGGETWLGSPRGQGVSDEWPRYRTRLAAFCLDLTEVTVGAYAECVRSGKCTPADRKRVTCTASNHAANFPINCVDAAQAEAFCAARGGRLPSEAEWEYAASGGDERLYAWGNEPPDGRACWKHAGACPVGSFGAGAFGLFDMTGNVWEWTSTGYGDYPWPAVESPNRVYRGGGWSRRFEKWMRVRLRNRVDPSERGSHLGFRCARSIDGEPCPFGAAADHGCLAGVLDADCREGKVWNGSRCAPAGEAGCGERHVLEAGHGCVWAAKIPEPTAAPLDLGAVKRARSPEFDHDCQTFQPARPRAHRFEGGSHEARNAVARAAGCKNRDVGVGWNSACCP
jgi:formylglycine-generating enzyme required for sulfatase activity